MTGPLNGLATVIHRTAVDHGFWPEEGRNFGEIIALAHSELSEALEEHRAGRPNVWFKHTEDCAGSRCTWPLVPDYDKCSCNPKPEGAGVELIDTIIRCLDSLGNMDIDIDQTLLAKMEYNNRRAYKHGKKY